MHSVKTTEEIKIDQKFRWQFTTDDLLYLSYKIYGRGWKYLDSP